MKRLRRASAIVALSLLASACTTRSAPVTPKSLLVGKWKCGTQIATYSDGSQKTIDLPETIMEFFGDGRYTSTNTRLAHRGTYELVSNDQISFTIRDANDPKVVGISGTNHFGLTPDRLRITTPTRGDTTPNSPKLTETTCTRL